MAESPLPMDSAFSPPSTKYIPNGHDNMSHDSHMTIPFPVNGVELMDIQANESTQTDSTQIDAFEDSFVDFNSNGAVEYDDTEDDFVDPLELARIRHLSTIKEAPIESSSSSADSEEDYIRLDEVSVLGKGGQPSGGQSQSASQTPTAEDAETPRVNSAVHVSSDSEHDYDQVALDVDHTHSTNGLISPSNVALLEDSPPQTIQASPSDMQPDTSLNTTDDHDKGEVNLGSPPVTTPTTTTPSVTTSSASIEASPLENEPMNIHTVGNDQIPASPEASTGSQVTPPTTKVSPEVHDTNEGVIEAPASPDIDVSSLPLTTPTVTDEVSTQVHVLDEAPASPDIDVSSLPLTTPTVMDEVSTQVHVPDEAPASPDLLTVDPQQSSGADERSQTPHGFLAMLSDALAAPPVLDGGNQGQPGEGVGENPPGDWLLPGEEQLEMDFDEPFFLPNLLPSVTPLEQCRNSDTPVCLPSTPPQTTHTSTADSAQDQAAVHSKEQAVTTSGSSVEDMRASNSGTSTNTGEAAQKAGTHASVGNTQPTAGNFRPRYVNVMVGGTTVQSAVPMPFKSKYVNVTVGANVGQSAVPMPSRSKYVNVAVGASGGQSVVPMPSVSETGSASRDDLESSTNLDHGVRTPKSRPGHSSPLGPTLSSPGGSPVILRHKIGDSPLSRRRNITSSPVGPREQLGMLQPLSPEHGAELSEQYDFLRRTLSHSHRRYSTRRRPNRKGRSQEEGGGGGGEEDPGLEASSAVTETESDQRRWRDILMSTESASPSHRSEGNVMRMEHHGRTYYMDHHTRTIAFDEQRRSTQHGRPSSSDLETRREMLERRYRSLNRSFRRNERPAVPRRNQGTELTPSASNNLNDNLSLTLTREEAEAMVRRESTPSSNTSRTKSKKKRNSSSGSGRRWPFSRKSSKSISQQGSTSGDDDILVISPGVANGDLEFRIPDSPTIMQSSDTRRSTSGSLDSESSLTRNSGVNSSPRDEVVATVSEASEQRVTGTTGPTHSGEAVTELQQGRSEISESTRHTSPEVSDLDRRDTIVRSSWLSHGDREAALVARRRATTRLSARRDSDEVTNEESSVTRRSTVLEPRTLDSPISPIEPGQPDEEEVREKPGERQLSLALANSPILRFITRRDLFSFLNSAGKAGKDFIASRALMELVQRIRSDNFLLEKYQHSRHLVNALNRFADQEADLPDDWEKKLNQQGKIFFIDHKHKVTTFIDPRLPLPDSVFTYSTRRSSQISSARRSALFSDEPEIRPHHVTTSSTSLGDMATPTEPVTPTVSEPPTPSGSVFGGESTAEGGPDNTRPTYEAQVVAFFRKPDVVDMINGRYQRGVRPQFRNIIEEIRLHGIPALERIQMSGSIAAYELALVLSLFEEDIGRIPVNAPPSTPAPVLVLNPPQPSPAHPAANTKNTLQRKKEAFSTKLQHFKIMMVRMGFAQGSRLKFNIRRDHLLEDAYEHVMKSDVKQLQTKRLNIAFKGEEGLDYGGPSREFFFLLSREIFNPYYGLFEYSANDTYTVQVNPTSEFLQNSLDWFRFAGRVVGLVIIQGFLLDAFFTRTVYKTFLSRPPTLKDLEAVEPAFYNSLLWIRENDPEPLDLTFTVEDEAFGELRSHELKEGGLDLLVTEDNKEEYISLMLKWRLDRGVAQQMEVLKKGFSEVMPPHLLVDFDAHELEFITAGTVEIDIEDWRNHTEYRNGYHPTHPVVLWFWKAVEAFDNEQRLRLLQFVTGTSSVPFEGFKALRGSNGPKRFTIDYYNDINAFPRTHTCFNRIDLPPYSSYEVLYEKLLFAVQEGGGFGIE